MAESSKSARGGTADYPKSEKTKARYDAFIREYHLNGNTGAQAAIKAGYSKNSARQRAVDLLSIRYIKEEIEKLQNAAKEEYTISLERRIKWLEKAVECGFRDCADAQGNIRAENLQASISGVKELNLMLGTTQDDQEAQSLNINFSVNDAVGEVKVTNANS